MSGGKAQALLFQAHQLIPTHFSSFQLKGKGSSNKDQGSRLKAQDSRLKAGGSRFKAQGSRTKVKDQGPCPAMNEHPRRDKDVILRQSKAPFELFNSR